MRKKQNHISHETLRVFLSAAALTPFPPFTGYLAEQMMLYPSCRSDRVMVFWILAVKVPSVFSSILLGASCWRFQVSWGGECGQGVKAEQVTVTDSFSFRSPEIWIVGLGGESVVSNQTHILHWKVHVQLLKHVFKKMLSWHIIGHVCIETRFCFSLPQNVTILFWNCNNLCLIRI